MKYKKFISSKSRFWVGIGACAVVGLIATVVSYFSSTQHIDNMYKSIFYRVSAYDVFDKTEVSSLNMDKETTVNTDIVVNDDSTTPVLVRIRYVWGYMDYVCDENDDRVPMAYVCDENGNPILDENGNPIPDASSGYKTAMKYDSWEENGNILYSGIPLCGENGYSGDCGFIGTAKNYVTEGNPNYPFLYNDYDGAYYYNKVLSPGEMVQHLDSLIFRSEGYDDYKDDENGVINFPNEWYGEDYLQNDGTWSYENKKIGRGISIGTGSSVWDGVTDKNIYSSKGLKIIVESVEAIYKDGKPLKLTGKETAGEMESYWNELGLRLPNWWGPNAE